MTSEPLRPDIPGTSDELLPEVYDELRKLARVRLARERHIHQTLQPTALVHEAYLRVSSPSKQWDRRGHFFAAAALAMRRILVERARHYQRVKHGAGQEQVELNDGMLRAEPGLTEVIAIDEALSKLAEAHPRQAQVVSLRYFAGLSVEETAAALDVSPATIKNEWASAREWLSHTLGSASPPDERFLDPARIPALDAAASDGPLQPGTALGDFLVLRAIGSGGMGVVYAAQQDRPRRTVAIKVLRRDLRHPEILKRFEREAEVLARLQHPGIAQVFAFHPGNQRIPAHLVMEFVSGPPITEHVQAHALDLAARLELLIAVCHAVQHAHDRGVVHRDLKPANVLISQDGQPKVLDFGIARATGLDHQSTMQTAHGQLLGTVAYMSPEQLRGATLEIDHRSDIFALGAMCGRLISDLNAGVRGAIDRVAARAMAADRADRHQSAADLAGDLRACLEGRPPAMSPARPLMAESPDGRLIALGLVNGTITVLDAASGARLAALPGDGAVLDGLAFESNTRLAISRGGTVNVIDLTGTV